MSDEHPLISVFPEDPNLPSLAYQSYENVPIYIPWNCKSVALGTGFNTASAAIADADGNPFCTTAFSRTSLAQTTLRYIEDTGSISFTQSSTSQTARSYEHVDLKFAASAGGWALGASVSGPYAKDVLKNNDTSKYSVRSTTRVGSITFTILPSLSSSAISCLQESTHLQAFHAEYGDYYVAGLRLGADNATMLSSSAGADSRSEMSGINVKGQVLGFKKELYSWQFAERYADAKYNITYSGFDTLSVFHQTSTATDPESYARIKEAAERNIEQGRTLHERVRHRMEQINLIPSATITPETCGRVCESGLVAELMLMPYAGLKESIAAMF